MRPLRPLSERIIGIFSEARKAVASIVSLCEPLLDAASGKIPILSDSSVEEASPVSFLSFPGKKGNEETTGVLRGSTPHDFTKKAGRKLSPSSFFRHVK